MATLMQRNTHPHPHHRWHLSLDRQTLEPLFVALTLAGIIAGSLLEWRGASAASLTVVAMATYFFGGFYAVREIIHALREKTIEV
ncbi:MAG: heavy metal translocating P-type ATPase, partial [Blastochloris sp.]|nr:heavy metal translocating P-type ATPase [Blastochloris sp.]